MVVDNLQRWFGCEDWIVSDDNVQCDFFSNVMLVKKFFFLFLSNLFEVSVNATSAGLKCTDVINSFRRSTLAHWT